MIAGGVDDEHPFRTLTKNLHYILNNDPNSIVHRLLIHKSKRGWVLRLKVWTIFDEYGKRVYDLCVDALQSQY